MSALLPLLECEQTFGARWGFRLDARAAASGLPPVGRPYRKPDVATLEKPSHFQGARYLRSPVLKTVVFAGAAGED
jgi:hypothetical protein